MKWPFSRDPEPDIDPTSLGNLLLEMGLLSRPELMFALRRQHELKDHVLGRVLIEEGLLDEGVIEAILVLQKARRGKDKDLQHTIEYVREQGEKIKTGHEDLRKALRKVSA